MWKTAFLQLLTVVILASVISCGTDKKTPPKGRGYVTVMKERIF
jgi:hypothetical protein